MSLQTRTPLAIPPLDHDTVVYMAGLLDGEGCCLIQRQHKHEGQAHYCYTPEVKIVLTHEGAIKHIAAKLGRPYQHIAARAGENWKDTYRVGVTDNVGIVALLEQLLPFLIVKRDIAAAMIAFCRSRREGWATKYNRGYSLNELQLYDEIRRLNHRGISTFTKRVMS